MELSVFLLVSLLTSITRLEMSCQIRVQFTVWNIKFPWAHLFEYDFVTYISYPYCYFSDWELLRCFHCGQGAVHKKCLGNCLLPKYDYVCEDCNKVIKMKINIVSVTPDRFQQRNVAHKRMLMELTRTGDPVLLMSVYAGDIWRERFDVKPCFVSVRKLDNAILKSIYQRKLKNCIKYFKHLRMPSPRNDIEQKGKLAQEKGRGRYCTFHWRKYYFEVLFHLLLILKVNKIKFRI